jgi:hypothetical protein
VGPDFFVLGAPASGAAALAAALARHPDLALLPGTPGFFLDPFADGRGPGDRAEARSRAGSRDYRRLLATAPRGVPVGETNPWYLADRAVHDRLHRAVPDARVVVVVRDPVDRAHAHWAQQRARGMEPLPDLRRACLAENERGRRGWGPAWRYVALGRAGEQVAHLLTRFPADRVHVVRADELIERPGPALDGVCRFLEARAGLLASVARPVTSPPIADTPATRALGRLLRAGATADGHLPAGVWDRLRSPLETTLVQAGAGSADPPAPRRRGPTRFERAELDRWFVSDREWLAELTAPDAPAAAATPAAGPDPTLRAAS